MSKELKEALVRANRIIDQWEENSLDSNEAMEMIAPLLKTITAHVENVDPAAVSSSDPNLAEDLETPEAEAKDKEKEELQEGEEGDLFSKTEDLESEDESKSKSKKKSKEFAGSNGEIPF